MPNAGATCVGTSKDTFWNQLRIEKGVTQKAMSEAVNIHPVSLSQYLTGCKLPSTPIAIKICDYFGVDYVTGAEEFNKAHEVWIAEHNGQSKKRSKIRKRKFDVDATTETETTVSAEPDTPNELPQKPTGRLFIQKILYGITSFEEFVTVMETSFTKETALKELYGKINADAYFALYQYITQINPS
jgi:DNA-binding XRE family transcriptional regulator